MTEKRTYEPHPKSSQLARGTRRYRRKVASPKRWQAIIDAKGATCACVWMEKPPCDGPIQYHHLVPRDFSGSDTENNILPICQRHHGLVTARNREACRVLIGCLTDAEYAYAIEHGGEGFFERAYGLKYQRVT